MKTLTYLKNYPLFIRDYLKFKFLTKQKRFLLSWRNRHPCLYDKDYAETFDRHYVFHTAWAARVLAKSSPREHVDIASSLYFSTLVSAFVPVKFYDYRTVDTSLSGLTVGSADLTSLFFGTESIQSLSCMHVVEHVGLGRYGDPLDPEGDLKAIKELKRVLAKSGQLLFVVPIGTSKICFNAHRIYRYEQILDYFSDLKLLEFALIPDNNLDGNLIVNPDSKLVDQQTYGCGCFWFQKK